MNKDNSTNILSQPIVSEGVIDLSLLIKTLWNGKKTIFLIVMLVFAASMLYVFRAPATWQISTIISYDKNEQSKNIENNLADFNAITGRNLDGLVDNNSVLKKFIAEFNDIKNKEEFIQLNELDSKSLDRIKIASLPDYQAVIENKGLKKSDIEHVLIGYMSFINNKTNSLINKEIQRNIYNYKKLKNAKVNLLKDKVKLEITNEKIKIKKALYIAEKMEIKMPVNNSIHNKFLFPVTLGENLLKYQYEELNNIKDLSLFNANISYQTAEVSWLDRISKNTTINNKIEHSKVKFKSEMINIKMILVISIIAGFIFGCCIVVSLNIFKNRM